MDTGTRTWQHNDPSESLDHHTIITQYHSTILGWAYSPPTPPLPVNTSHSQAPQPISVTTGAGLDTKALRKVKFSFLCCLLGLVPVHPSPVD